jgi:hypothetical protein
MAQTGQLNPRTGFYRSTCCNHELPVSRFEHLPPCSVCEEAATWIPVVHAPVHTASQPDDARPAA